ncbi:alpha/beta-hydrolase [Thozetella sp. PMI_491]|nr:alpha/beta-hydrolase [Thozetella sp. PMI_491]
MKLLAAYAVGLTVLTEVQTVFAKKDLFLGGGLTILSQNLLDAASNNGTAAILVQQPSPYYAAKTACMLLGELPWNPDTQPFNVSLRTSLGYQAYQGAVPADQLYWIAKEHDADDDCRGINAAGTIFDLDCRSEVPTLCTQSAPTSNSSFANSSADWRVSHFVGQKQLTGYRDLHTWKFRGLRYAQPAARFTYSQLQSFEDPGEIDATTAGADCSQPIGEVKNGSSEDCLFANVWTPYLPRMAGVTKSQLKPVMLYYYGGGFTSGSGKNPNTDGTNLASRGDVVVVSVNYRVGSIGFLTFNDGVHKGNYGISDMVTALEWVQKYISYFGGDPDRVTIFGESAGASSVHTLLNVPKARGLFQQAIMMSSPDGWPQDGHRFAYPRSNTVEQEYNGVTQKVLKAAGCQNATNQIACLGKLSGFQLVNLTTNANGIVQDGTYVMSPELVVNQTGPNANVTVIAGFNRDESGVNIEDYPQNGTTFANYFDASVAPKVGLKSNSTAVLQLNQLNVSELHTPEQIFNMSLKIATGGTFNCLNMAKVYSAAKHGAFKQVYSFMFNRTYSTSGYTKPWCDAPKTAERPNGDPDKEYYKCHAGEQMLVFGTARRSGRPERDGLDVPFMQLIVDYWSAFARNGDPNPDKGYLAARGYSSTLERIEAASKWEPVRADNPRLRLLQWNGAQIPFVDQASCRVLGLGMDSLEP